ncbi:MAG: hypothetical protein HMLKMBBP_03051 [Planctomycetes bacterium]|nr:hypothetical protein [Planctomycetota bacterium]
MSDTNPEQTPPSGGDDLPNPTASQPSSGAAADPVEETILPSHPTEMDATIQEGFADDGDFSEHYTLLFASLSMFIGCTMLPIEARHLDLYAKDGIAGGFLAIFAGYGVLAAWMNIHNRKMIMWPMLFGALDGLYLTITRELALIDWAQRENVIKEGRDWVVKLGGPGLYVIFFACLVVLWTLVKGVAKGAAKAKARAAASKARRG